MSRLELLLDFVLLRLEMGLVLSCFFPYPTRYQVLVARSYFNLKNAFAANVVGAPVTAVAPFAPIVSVVTDCVQFTRTSCLSTNPATGGSVIVPAAYPATGVSIK